MTTGSTDLLLDAFDRIRASVTAVLADLDRDDLSVQVAPDANPIGWLVWHLLRVQDDHFAEAAGTEQVWTSGRWFDRFESPYPIEATGYGHSPDDVAALDVEPDLLEGYSGAVHDATARFIRALDDAALDRIVDDAWDPPVSLGTRIISVIGDDLKHVGQAEYVRGIVRPG